MELENKEQEIRSSANAGVFKAMEEYDSSKGYCNDLLKWLVYVGTNRAIDILRSPSERLVDRQNEPKRFKLINESDYFWRYPNTLDYFPKFDKIKPRDSNK